MYRKDVHDRSPLRILEQSIRGGLGRGNLGVVMARHGVGKTAFLVQIALDEAMRDRPVLHLAVGGRLDHTMGWYQSLFEHMVPAKSGEATYELQASVARRRIIQAFPEERLTPERLEQVIGLYGGVAFRPAVVVIDGFDWEGGEPQRRDELQRFKTMAKALDAELWMSATTHRASTPVTVGGLFVPCSPFADLIDVAVYLEPQGNQVTVRLLKDHESPTPSSVRLVLDPVMLGLVEHPSARDEA